MISTQSNYQIDENNTISIDAQKTVSLNSSQIINSQLIDNNNQSETILKPLENFFQLMQYNFFSLSWIFFFTLTIFTLLFRRFFT